MSEGFLPALNVPLLSGRMLDADDGPTAQRAVVINRLMATRYWPGENPIGKLIRAKSMEAGANGAPAPWLTVVGVVGNVRTWGLEADPLPEMYVSFRQAPSERSTMTAVVRGDMPAARLLSEVRIRTKSIDPHIAFDLSTLDARLQSRMAPRRLTMSLLAGFAFLALIVAAVGVYGVLSYSVTQRTRELAVRAAIGAQRSQLLWLVMRSGARVVCTGAIVGVVAGLGLTRFMSSMLVDVTPNDPMSYALSFAALAVVCLASILVPSLRATRLDPAIALQAE